MGAPVCVRPKKAFLLRGRAVVVVPIAAAVSWYLVTLLMYLVCFKNELLSTGRSSEEADDGWYDIKYTLHGGSSVVLWVHGCTFIHVPNRKMGFDSFPVTRCGAFIFSSWRKINILESVRSQNPTITLASCGTNSSVPKSMGCDKNVTHEKRGGNPRDHGGSRSWKS